MASVDWYYSGDMEFGEIGKILFFTVFGCFGIFFLVSTVREKRNQRRVKNRLEKRPSLNDSAFEGEFFADDPALAKTACRIRNILSDTLGIPLDGLHPEDKLKVDLGAGSAEFLCLFYEFEEEFRIETGVSDDKVLNSGELDKCVEKLVTFSDLVDYVQNKIAERPSEESLSSDEEEIPKAYDYAIDCIPYLCITGFVTIIIGWIIDKEWALTLGTILFFSGFAVWGFANGGGLLWMFIQNIREEGFQGFKDRPVRSLFGIVFLLFFMWIGLSIIWMFFKFI